MKSPFFGVVKAVSKLYTAANGAIFHKETHRCSYPQANSWLPRRYRHWQQLPRLCRLVLCFSRPFACNGPRRPAGELTVFVVFYFAVPAQRSVHRGVTAGTHKNIFAILIIWPVGECVCAGQMVGPLLGEGGKLFTPGKWGCANVFSYQVMVVKYFLGINGGYFGAGGVYFALGVGVGGENEESYQDKFVHSRMFFEVVVWFILVKDNDFEVGWRAILVISSCGLLAFRLLVSFCPPVQASGLDAISCERPAHYSHKSHCQFRICAHPNVPESPRLFLINTPSFYNHLYRFNIVYII